MNDSVQAYRIGVAPSRPVTTADQWEKTQAMTAMATRVVGDEEAYLEDAERDIGRRVGADRHELFVVCDPAQALQQQLEHLAPEYLALHDIASTTGPALLTAVAAALELSVRQLVVRRQGFGTTLAQLDFVELPGGTGRPPLRLYSTRIGTADSGQRALMVDALLGHSRLGVLLVGRADASVDSDLAALARAINGQSWHNRHLLCVPMHASSAAPLAAWARALRAGVHALIAPPQPGMVEAWRLVQDVWGQLRAGREPALPSHADALATPSEAAVAPTAVVRAGDGRPPAAAPAAPPAAASAPMRAQWTDYLRRCFEIPGVTAGCIVDVRAGRALASAGGPPAAAELAEQAAALLTAAAGAASALELPAGQPDVALTFREHYLLLRSVPGHAGLALHLVLDARAANLTLARMKLQRIDAPVPGQAA